MLYALTGPPGCGKTTAVLKVIKGLRSRGVEVEGVYTEEIRERGRRVGFAIKRISGGSGILAHINLSSGPKHGKYGVNLRDLESIAVAAILEGIRSAEVVVVDEVGPMELRSTKFRDAVEELLRSDKNAVLTVHYRSRDPLVSMVKRAAGGNLIVLTPENRDRVPGKIVEEILRALRSRSP